MNLPTSLPLCATFVLSGFVGWCIAQEPLGDQREALERLFAEHVQPLLKKQCISCHGPDKQEGKLDLSGFSSVAKVADSYQLWMLVLERVEGAEMPPEEAPSHPSREDRTALIAWIKSLHAYEAEKHAGDPGIVLARRLSNAEYDYSIRDLTGQDLRPTREFPIDPANEAGFDNSGQSLTMSPALVKKYLAAARSVADHVVLLPRGWEFAPHAMVAETDRDKFCVRRIVEFYEQHAVDYADYFLAAWRFEHRAALGQPRASLREVAEQARLSPKYLTTVWEALHVSEERGPLKEVQAQWQKLPGDPHKEDDVRGECVKLRDFVLKQRKELEPKIEKLKVRGNSEGSQPLLLWWNRQIATRRMKYSGDGADTALDTARDRFCRVFPSAFALTSRGHYADSNLGAEVRLLTAGFHLMQGYFRDDEPLCQLVLSDAEKNQIDALWRELNFITFVPLRQYKDFLFFERAEPPRFAGGAEFDFARPEDKDVTSAAKLERMRVAYLAKAREQQASDEALEAIETYFANMSTDIRWIERARLEAEPSHLETLAKFAARAYRRPLTQSEHQELLAYYHSLRDQQGLSHEDAIRDSIASVLMSPFFSYRFDLVAPGDKAVPLSDYELASRLSYFLWSSVPDDELLAHAAAGDLHEPHVLKAQARRMLGDQRIERLATEFLGNLLEFRHFEQHNSVDRGRFPSFNNELREAMYEEPIRYFTDLAQRNGSVRQLITGRHTFVNPVLAKHYGIALPTGSDDGWVRIDDAEQYGRGGLLPMALFLTKSSPGLRTSPVKRGYWVVRRLLGEHIPAPPPNVPELPADEARPGELSLAQELARHRSDKNCAGCHQRFDAIGLVFEGYGPIGERREKDLGGRPVQTKAEFPDGEERQGVNGLREYLRHKRGEAFVGHFSRQLFSYALGRTPLPSDQPTLKQMQTKLTADDYTLGSLVESIVTSPEFLHKRGETADERE